MILQLSPKTQQPKFRHKLLRVFRTLPSIRVTGNNSRAGKYEYIVYYANKNRAGFLFMHISWIFSGPDQFYGLFWKFNLCKVLWLRATIFRILVFLLASTPELNLKLKLVRIVCICVFPNIYIRVKVNFLVWDNVFPAFGSWIIIRTENKKVLYLSETCFL